VVGLVVYPANLGLSKTRSSFGVELKRDVSYYQSSTGAEVDASHETPHSVFLWSRRQMSKIARFYAIDLPHDNIGERGRDRDPILVVDQSK